MRPHIEEFIRLLCDECDEAINLQLKVDRDGKWVAALYADDDQQLPMFDLAGERQLIARANTMDAALEGLDRLCEMPGSN